jgi:hypothetical protein
MRNPLTRAAAVTAGLACVAAFTVTGVGAASAATKPPAKTTLKKAVVTITAPTTVTKKTAFKEVIHGRVSSGGAGLAGRTVLLEGRPSATSRWTAIGRQKTSKATTGKKGTKAGAVSFTVVQSGRTEQYELVLVAGGGYSAATSKILTVKRA